MKILLVILAAAASIAVWPGGAAAGTACCPREGHDDGRAALSVQAAQPAPLSLMAGAEEWRGGAADGADHASSCCGADSGDCALPCCAASPGLPRAHAPLLNSTMSLGNVSIPQQLLPSGPASDIFHPPQL